MNAFQQSAISHLLFHCGSLSKKDIALILCDPDTRDLAEGFVNVALNQGYSNVHLLEIPSLSNHGAEPPTQASDVMCQSTLILSLCRYSLAHSSARQKAATCGARFLSLPLYDWPLLEDPSVHVDFKKEAPRVKHFADTFTRSQKVEVATVKGTHITLEIGGRIGNYCPGFVEKAGDLGSPPDIEANVSPIEDKSEGTVIIDGSITHPDLGLLTDPVTLVVRKGRIVEFQSQNKKYIEKLNNLFGALDSPRRVLAECGVGLNPAAKLTGTMLTDEGALGCMHFGFGANHTVGGKNKVDFHLDFVFHDATLKVDDIMLLDAGVPQ